MEQVYRLHFIRLSMSRQKKKQNMPNIMNSSATEISSSHRPKEERTVLENTSRKLAQELQQTKLKLKKIEQENKVLQSKN